jgi:hypothetical protein
LSCSFCGSEKATAAATAAAAAAAARRVAAGGDGGGGCGAGLVREADSLLHPPCDHNDDGDDVGGRYTKLPLSVFG